MKRIVICAAGLAAVACAQVALRGKVSIAGKVTAGGASSVSPDANWGLPWVPITVPAGVLSATGKLQSVFAGNASTPLSDLYISSRLGIHRAAKSDLIANPTSATWTLMNTGMINTAGVYEPCQGWGINALGNLVCGAGKVNQLALCVFTLNTTTWSCTTTNINQTTSSSIKVIVLASNGDLYALSYFASTMYKSTDNGTSWSVVFTSAYTDNGFDAGGTYSGAILGNVFYFGGESNAMVEYDLGTLGITSELPEPTYAGNCYGITGDGNATTGPITEMVVQRTNSGIYRKTVATGLWSSKVGVIAIPGGGGNTTDFFQWLGVTNGTTSHEYYLAGGRTSFNQGGVIGSVDGGVTWAFVGDVQTCASGDCPSRITIGSSDDKWMVANTSRLFYHP